jgi:glyoxylase-like metal-dependent hydrolase (beta-lactamase superfamily II)
MSPVWLSNTYLVADRPGGHAVLIDTGGPTAPILRAIEELRVEVTHVLCTHHHLDHVQHNRIYADRFGCPICGHHAEAGLFGDLDVELTGDQELRVGDLRIRALHLPGHTLGQLGFLVNDVMVFTGDTLFRRTIGGTRGTGHTTFEDLQHSLVEVLMRLPPATIVQPGHTVATTIGEEWDENPFIRLWRGLEAPGDQRCTAFGQPATLLLRAVDYDGGDKCQVRFDAGARVDVVPGSRVELV